MSHLTDGQLHAFLDGSVEDLADAEPSDVRSHVKGCADCRARLEAARLVRDRAHSLLRVAAPPSLAPPPIQDPATVASPLQTASGPCPPTVSGLMNEKMKTAKGPPRMMLIVPVKNMISALGPSLRIPCRSMLSVSNTKVAGSK